MFGNTAEPIARACSVQDVEVPEVLAQCRRIAAALRHSDTILVEAFGTTLALRLWPQDSAQNREIRAERRGLSYRADLMSRNRAKFSSAEATRSLAACLVQFPTEQAAFRALISKLGFDPDPPADWKEPSTD
jgi:hypothetical protein